jgi:uncharacterized protein with HEPN domain
MDENLVQDGTIRQLEVIGEAAKWLSEEFKEEHPDVPWRDMAGMRDRLIHGYFGVDLDAVWETVDRDIPQLKKYIRDIVGKMERTSEG